MFLGNLIKSAGKKYQKVDVKGICFDSRKVREKDIFFAIDGNKTSGTKFINEAISKKASAIITSKNIKLKNSEIPLLTVKDVRKSLSEACSNFYKRKPLYIVAVTGTNGKSSVADFFYQILNFNKKAVASIGTLGIASKNNFKKTNLTSLDPLSLHKNLKILAKNKVQYVILEASSHGLDQKRLDNLIIKTGIFTNLSHDHLDYHKNIKSYFYSKMHLFKNLLNSNSNIVTDEENKEFKIIKSIANKRKIKKITIGSKSGDIKILHNSYRDNKQIIKILFRKKIFFLEVPLIGYFQIKNLLMAILAANNCGININKIFKQINQIKPVPGRLESVVNLNNNSAIIVDFAHTPDALEQTLIALKKQFKREITIVFGCGGERDKRKRLIMGKIAKKYCKKIFITDDNPRNEDPRKIRKDIIKGCGKFAKNIGSRKKAIKNAIDELGSNEILLVSGKGHEKTQDYGKRVINFSDKKIIKELISKKKFVSKNSYYQSYILKRTFKKKKLINLKYNGVSINTKLIKKNDLFFAIPGKKKDGHDFINQAVKKGATRVIVSKKVKQVSKTKIIKVKNTLFSLNDLADATRAITSAKVIGITGSVGKTTLKNLVGFALKNYAKIYHSPHSYNNKFGVPLSVSNLKKDVKYGIFEIGMDKKGEIDNLSKIVKPEVAVITNISGAHFKNFNTLKDIAKAKGEIIDNILDNGYLILNKDDNFFNFLSLKAQKRGINVISFSCKKKADVSLLKIKKIKNYYRLKISVKERIYTFDTKYSIKSFIYNILACVSVLSTINLDLNILRKKFINFKIPHGRGDIKLVKKFKKRFKFIDESYNANPLSMKEAISNINSYKRRNNLQKLVLLGDMLELGKKSKKFHKELSAVINRTDIDKVFVYGKYIKETYKSLSLKKKGRIFKNLKEAYNHLGKIIHNNDLLMIKGSNATGLNQFSKNIKKDQIRAL